MQYTHMLVNHEEIFALDFISEFFYNVCGNLPITY